MSTILNLDNYTHQYIYDTNTIYSNTPSPSASSTSVDSSNDGRFIMNSPSSSMSPMSTSSDTSTYNLQNLNIQNIGNNQYYRMDGYQPNNRLATASVQYDSQSNMIKPQLYITEQPVDKFRFRYKSEMHGTHGSLMGSNTEKTKKTYPSVELRGYNGEAIIRCSLYQADSLKRSQHSHKLVVRNGDVDLDDPHDVIVSPEKGFTAIFQGMGIIHTAKKYITEELIKKKIQEKQVELGTELSQREEYQIKTLAEQESRSMNLNQVCLCFQCFVKTPDGLKRLCEPVYSKPINNMKSALTGELKISRLSAAVSSAAGGDDLFLFVEKVGKKNIKVRFFEIDDYDQEIWEDWGNFTEIDVHHQYAIALKTPAYKDKDIDRTVDVFIQLYRPSDQDRSEPMPFKYKPRNYLASRKRPRMNSNYSTSLSSSELPTTVPRDNNNGMNRAPTCGGGFGDTLIGHQMMQQHPLEASRISAEYNKFDIIQNLLDDPLPNSLEFTSADYKEFLKANSDEYTALLQTNFGQEISGNMHAIDSAATVSGVIKRGPGAPPMPHDEDYASEVFQKIMTVTRIYQSNPAEVKTKVSTLFKEACKNGENILHSTLRKGDPKIIKLLNLVNQYEVYDLLEVLNEKNQNSLHIACLVDKPEYIRPLINLGSDPNISDTKGNTPLHIAVEENLQMCVEKLLDNLNYTTPRSKAIRIDLANDQGMTALHIAVRNHNLEITKKLLKAGASVKISEKKHGNNVLHIAVEQNSVDVVQYIIEQTTINVNQTNNSGYTPLHLACAGNNDAEAKKIVQLLLKHKADPSMVQNNLNILAIINDNGDGDNSDSDVDIEPPRSSFDLAKNKPEILQILNKFKEGEDTSIKTSITVKEEPMDDEDNSEEEDDDDEYGETKLEIDESESHDSKDDTMSQSQNKAENAIKMSQEQGKKLLFDEQCLEKLYKIFNKDNTWKKLATLLEIQHLTSACEFSENPSKILFNIIEIEKIPLENVVTTFENIDEMEAINCVDEMLAKRMDEI